MEPHQPHSYHEDARQLTEDPRTSDAPEWKAVRAFLTDAGFAPEESAVGDLFSEQSGDFGVLVTGDRKIFTFEVGWEPVRGERGKRRYWVTHNELVDAGSRFAYARAAAAAMTLLKGEQPSDIRPLDVLVEYVAQLTDIFRDIAARGWSDRWKAQGYWAVLHAFLRDRSIDPMKSVALHWASTGDEIDGGLLDSGGRCYHFTCSLETLHGPIRDVTTWDELDMSGAQSMYGDLTDAGLELLRSPNE